MPKQLIHVFRSILACLVLSPTFIALLPTVAADDTTTATPEVPRSLQGGQVKVLFDGQSLVGWRGRDDLWAVEEGMIVGRTNENRAH